MSNTEELDLSKAPILSHLIELRTRLLKVLALFAVAFAISYWQADHIYAFLTRPLLDVFGEEHGRRMIYTGLHEAFVTYLKLALFTALLVTLPVILNQLWKFLAPGLYQFERKAMQPFFWMTPVLFLTGAAMAYYVVFPLAWKFFIGFETAAAASGGMPVALEARVGEYLSLVIRMILAFGLSFELPMLLLLLARVGLVNADLLSEYRKHAVVIVFALAALITPPDLISQIALGVPILLLYEVAIIAIRWSERRQQTTVTTPSESHLD